jgi:hypothetical protein
MESVLYREGFRKKDDCKVPRYDCDKTAIDLWDPVTLLFNHRVRLM